MGLQKFTDKQLLELLEKKISIAKSAKILNVHRSTILKRLRKLKIKVPNYHNICKFNHRIFNEINTEEKAYWLGFIFADGCIYSNSYGFELSLSLKDENHLKKFADFMDFPERFKKDSYRCRFIVTNKHLWNVLNSYGCTPRKSLTLKFPDIKIFKSPELISHFIRGYFDGDGCMSLTRNDRLVCQVLGTKEFLEGIQNYTEMIRTFHKNKKHTGNTYSYAYSHTPAIKFAEYLYKDSNIYLERKFNKYRFAVLQSNL